MADNNTIYALGRLPVDVNPFEFDPNTEDFIGGLESLLSEALKQKNDLGGQVGIIVKVDPPGRWNPNNNFSKQMGMNFDLAKAGMGTGLVFFPKLNAGDQIPKNVVPNVNKPDNSHKFWARSSFVFTAPIDELSSLQVPQVALFSNSVEQLVLVKKLQKADPSLWVGKDPCAKEKTVNAAKPREKTKTENKKKTECNVITENQLSAMIINRGKRYPTFNRETIVKNTLNYWNKYFKEYDICTKEEQAHIFAQCLAESGLIYPFPFVPGTFQPRAVTDDTSKYRYYEGGYIHLATPANYRKFNDHIKQKYPDKKFPNLLRYPSTLRNSAKGAVHYELAVLSACWYFSNHKVPIRTPKGWLGGSRTKQWSCLDVVKEFSGGFNDFISIACTSVVFAGGKTWASDPKFRKKFTPNYIRLCDGYLGCWPMRLRNYQKVLKLLKGS